MTTEYKLLVTASVNITENYMLDEQRTPLKDTIITNLKDLYKYGLKNYGKCTGKQFRINKYKESIHIGYTFEKKCVYEDTKETYVLATWLSIEHYKETIEREYFMVS